MACGYRDDADRVRFFGAPKNFGGTVPLQRDDPIAQQKAESREAEAEKHPHPQMLGWERATANVSVTHRRERDTKGLGRPKQ